MPTDITNKELRWETFAGMFITLAIAGIGGAVAYGQMAEAVDHKADKAEVATLTEKVDSLKEAVQENTKDIKDAKEISLVNQAILKRIERDLNK